jgi:tetratricopeptide (TPR) repeat protein
MRAVSLVAGVILSGFAAISAAHAVTQQQVEECANNPKRFLPDLSIGSCTAAIQSGRWSGKHLAWAFFNRGNAYAEKNDNDRAIVEYSEAIRLDPKFTVAFTNRGNAYMAKKEYDRAIADYDRSIRIKPTANAYANRAVAYGRSGDQEKAIADLRKALSLGHAQAAEHLRRLGLTP